MNKTAYFALGSMAALAVLVVGALATSAATTNSADQTGQQFRKGEGMHMMENREDMEAHRQEMQDFMETADYDTWRAAVEEHAVEMENGNTPRILEDITAENFDQFKQMHELMQSGDTKGARAIADELGLPQHGRMMGAKAMRHGDGEHMGQGRQFRDNNGDGFCDNLDVGASQN